MLVFIFYLPKLFSYRMYLSLLFSLNSLLLSVKTY